MKYFNGKIKLLLLAAAILLTVQIVTAQEGTQERQLAAIEQKVGAYKKGADPESLKSNRSLISDIENRKNNMKMMLKTPAASRDKAWTEKWNEQHTVINDKLSKLK
jgi:hypothetical protein